MPTSCLPSASRHEGRTQERSSLQLFVSCFGRIMKSVSAIYPALLGSRCVQGVLQL